MNSTKKRKQHRKVIVAHCRKSSSVNNRNQSFSCVMSSGNYKRRISALLKNNRVLARALQDARCDLSKKTKLLEDDAKSFNDIMHAWNKMLEMHSTLKCFVKNFDDTLFSINMDGAKWSDFRGPSRSCRNFKSKLERVVESNEEVSEAKAKSADQEKVKCARKMNKSSNHVISTDSDSTNKDCTSMEIAGDIKDKPNAEDMNIVNQNEHNEPLHVYDETVDSVNCTNAGDIEDNHLPSVLFSENSEGVMDTNIEIDTHINSSENLSSLKDRGSPETPKLSIPNQVFKSVINSQATSDLKIHLSHGNSSSPAKNISKILSDPPNVLPSQVVKSSKIPKFCDIHARKKSNSSDVDSKKKLNAVKAVDANEEHGLKVSRRKTFVVKNAEKLTADSKSSLTLDHEEILDENSSNSTKESKKNTCRKTFVIKNLDISDDNCKFQCDRRKTFVKKSTEKIKQHATMQTRRDTFILSETKEECINEIATAVTENSVDKENQNETYQYSNAIAELPPTVGNEIESIEPNIVKENIQKFQSNLKNTGDIKMICSLNQSQDEEMMKDTNKNSFKAVGINETTVNCDIAGLKDGVKLLDTGAFCQGDVQDGIESNDENDIEILLDTSLTRKHKTVSYKHFLESSSSECESISDIDIDFDEEVPSTKATPIRGRISGSKKNKTFTFNVPRRKSFQNQKSNKPKKHSNEYNGDNVNTAKNQKLKERKSVKFDCRVEICKRDAVDQVHCGISEDRQEQLKILATDEKCVKSIEKNIEGDENRVNFSPNFTDNVDKNMLCPLKSHNYSPVITFDKIFNTIENESDNLGPKHKKSKCTTRKKSCTTKKIQSDKQSDKAYQKLNKSKDDIPVDDIKAKKVTRNNSKDKLGKKISFQEEIIASNLVTNDISDTLVASDKVKNKSNNKPKRKTKTKSLCKTSRKNAIIVKAEVHPPPRVLNSPETEIIIKEITGLENYNVSVVLNDVFDNNYTDLSNFSYKTKLSEGRTIPPKTPFSDSSRNIPTSVVKNDEFKNGGSSTFIEENISNKRTRMFTYKEPSLRKKLRR